MPDLFRHALAAAMLSGAAGLFGATGAAQAGPLTADTLLADYNVIVTGNLTTTNDVEGAAVVGGSLGGTPTFFNTDVPGSNGFPGSANVLLYGANNATSLNRDAGGTLTTAPALPLAAYTQPLVALSASLGALPANAAGAADNSGNYRFAYSGNAAVAVFQTTGADLAAALAGKNVQFALGGAGMAVVDVTGNFAAPGNANFNAPSLRNVIFNFVDAATVDVGNWEASILAPGAAVDITGGGHIEGSVFAASFDGGGELHNFTFTGPLPQSPWPDHPPASVPEPETWLLLGAAVSAVFIMRRGGVRRH